MKRIIKFFKKYTSDKYYKISILIFLLSTIVIRNDWFGYKHLIEVSNGVGMIDMSIINTVDGIYNKLLLMGMEGRHVYASLLKLDYLIIFSLGIFQIIVLLRLIKASEISSKWEHITNLPILRGVLDGIENILLYSLTMTFPTRNVWLLKITSVVIFTKWIAFWLTIAMILILIGVKGYKRRKRDMKKNMSIIGLTASGRGNSLGRQLVTEALKSAEALGANIEMIDLYKSKLQYCTGCLKCMEEGKCLLNDNFEIIKNKLHDADGIIICAPTYCGTFNSVLKNFIDRLGLYERFTSSLGEKYVISISTAGSKRLAKQTAKSMAKLLTSGIFARGYISGVMGSSSRFNDEKDAESLRLIQERLQEAEKLGRKLVKDIEINKKYLFQNIFNRALSKFILKPIYTKVIIKNKDKNTYAVYNSLLEREIISISNH